MIIQKFGGTSLGTAERLLNVANIILENQKVEPLLIVVSAMSSYIKSEGTTSLLLESAKRAINQEDFQPLLTQLRENHLKEANDSIQDQAIKKEVVDFINFILDELNHFLKAITIIEELSSLSSDRIIRVGEKLSAYILSRILRSKGAQGAFVDLANIAPKGFSTPTPKFYKILEANILEKLTPLLNNKKILVITGFIGQIPQGIIQSIGRGYTDYTASLVAAILQAKELQIWKEVDGIFTTDPRLVPEAEVLETITPIEASELTYFGSEVIHPFTMERVTRANIPIRIKNTFSPNLLGTLIVKSNHDQRLVKAITVKRDVTIFNICSNRMLMAYGFMAKVFNLFEKFGVIIDLISTSEVNISLTVGKINLLDEVIEELSELGEVTIYQDNAILSMVGQGMRSAIGLAGKMFSSLSDNGINIEMISQGASEINISCVIRNSEADHAVQILHKRFINPS